MGEWRAGRAVKAAMFWRVAVYWHEPGIGWSRPWHCQHQHRLARTARQCAEAEARRRNRQPPPPED